MLKFTELISMEDTVGYIGNQCEEYSLGTGKNGSCLRSEQIHTQI